MNFELKKSDLGEILTGMKFCHFLIFCAISDLMFPPFLNLGKQRGKHYFHFFCDSASSRWMV